MNIQAGGNFNKSNKNRQFIKGNNNIQTGGNVNINESNEIRQFVTGNNNIQAGGNVNINESNKNRQSVKGNVNIQLSGSTIKDSYIGNIGMNVSNGRDRITIVDGIEYPWVKGMKGNSVTLINNKTYIDGYELKDGCWKKTLKAFYYNIF